MNVLLLCLKIFFARIIDVSLDTIKTVFVIKEKRLIATLIAFVELLIWFEVVREALNTDIDSIFIPISYALGYATGTNIGILLSSRYIHGNLTVYVISSKITNKEINYLKKQGFGVSSLKLENNSKYLIIEIEKKNLKKLKECLKKVDSKAFIIINDTKIVQNGYI